MGRDTGVLVQGVDVHAEAIAHARAVHHELIELSQRIDDTFLEVGVRLKEVRDADLYHVLEYPNFTAYVKNLEFSRSRAYALIGVVEDFYLSSRLDKGRLLALGWEKLALLRSAKGALTFEAWVEKATRWGKRQLRQALCEAGFLPASKAKHDDPVEEAEQDEQPAPEGGEEAVPLYYVAAKKLTALKLLKPEELAAAKASGVYPLIVAVVGTVYAKHGPAFGLPAVSLPNNKPVWASRPEEA